MAAVRVALAQVNPSVGDLEANARIVRAAAAEASRAGASVVLFGEMVLTGYPVEDLALRPSFQHAAVARLEELAGQLEADGLGELMVIVGSLGLNTASHPTNEAAILHHGRISTRYSKHHLPTYGVFDEARVFAPGHEPCTVEVGGLRLGIVVCEDIWHEDGPVQQHVGADALLVLNASPFEYGKRHVRHRVTGERAQQISAPVLYVNLVGGQDDLVFDGASFVSTREGDVLAAAPGFTDGLLVVDISAGGDLTVVSGAATERDVPAEEEIYDAAVLGLRDYVRKNGFTKVALGLSGGIDSALVAAMAVDAVGAEHVVGISMPSSYSSGHSRDDARDLAARAGLDYRVQPIAPMVDAFQGELALTGIAEENLQARMRGVILMAVSNAEDALVLATGNKSELAVGYSTIYGDAVGGFAPIKDVSKTRVWRLARWRNDKALDAGALPPIPESSITKPPSAELRPGQQDSDSLPDYEVLDGVLDAYVERAVGRSQLLEAGFDADVVDLVLRLVDRAEWKRRQYPLGPKVTSLAFGRDRRLPVSSGWREPALTTKESSDDD